MIYRSGLYTLFFSGWSRMDFSRKGDPRQILVIVMFLRSESFWSPSSKFKQCFFLLSGSASQLSHVHRDAVLFAPDFQSSDHMSPWSCMSQVLFQLRILTSEDAAISITQRRNSSVFICRIFSLANARKWWWLLTWLLPVQLFLHKVLKMKSQ